MVPAENALPSRPAAMTLRAPQAQSAASRSPHPRSCGNRGRSVSWRRVPAYVHTNPGPASVARRSARVRRAPVRIVQVPSGVSVPSTGCRGARAGSRWRRPARGGRTRRGGRPGRGGRGRGRRSRASGTGRLVSGSRSTRGSEWAVDRHGPRPSGRARGRRRRPARSVRCVPSRVRRRRGRPPSRR